VPATTLHVHCPECDQVIPITIQAELARDQNDQFALSIEPDLTELAAHTWTHADA
jgi:hypothetical protein